MIHNYLMNLYFFFLNMAVFESIIQNNLYFSNLLYESLIQQTTVEYTNK